LKPEHIIIRPDGTVVLIDTGIAASIGVYEGHALVGTPSYLAPEIGLGYMVSSRADLYALGCVFYEMITGHPPFGGDTDTLIIAGHIHLPVPSIDGEMFDVCKTVLGQLLSKDPSQRPFSAQSVDELLSATDFYTDGSTRQRKGTKLGLGEAMRY